MPRTRKTSSYVDQQERAAEFQVGHAVVHWGHPIEESGRVTAVYPAIGMVDVQYPWGNVREPVEEIHIVDEDTWIVTPRSDDTPGGSGTVPLSGGPHPRKQASASRVAQAYLKKAIYWQERDRKYRARKDEADNGQFYCPKCRDTALRNAVYKRENGSSVRLLGCPACLFLVKREDLTGLALPEPPPRLRGE